ncbi:MAG: PH domain-containing protein [Clostridia bacterium]|nr:PH domain-containing protein [Clostridia bacterium]
MFCKECGNFMNDDAAFCNSCGTPVGQVANNFENMSVDSKKEDNVVRLTLKPTFVLGYQILRMIGNSLVWLFIIQLWIIDIIAAFSLMPALAWGIIALVFGIHLIKLFFEKAQYKKIEYRFLKTKVEYVDGFLNKEEKQLKYEHVREVTMSQNVLERMFGIGRIRLYTNASSAYNTGRNHNQTGKNGIDIHCIVNVKEQHKLVKEILDEIENQY